MTCVILTALPLLLWQSTHHLTIKYSTASLADPGDGRDSSGALSDCLEVLGTRSSLEAAAPRPKLTSPLNVLQEAAKLALPNAPHPAWQQIPSSSLPSCAK